MAVFDKTLQWTRQSLAFNSTGNESTWSASTIPGKSSHPIAVDSDGSLYFTHIVQKPISGTSMVTENDIVIGKMSSQGSLQWLVQPSHLNTNNTPQDPSIAVGTDGVYIMFSVNGLVSGNTSSGLNDIVVAKLDKSNGSISWIKRDANFNTAQNEFAGDIVVDSSNNVYVCFSSFTPASYNDNHNIFVAMFDSNGNQGWSSTVKSVFDTSVVTIERYQTAPSMVLDSTGQYLYVGAMSLNPTQQINGRSDTAISKINISDGSIVWNVASPTYNTFDNDWFVNLTASSDGGIVGTYYSNRITSGGSVTPVGWDVVVFKLDSTGTAVWTVQPTELRTVSTFAYADDIHSDIAIDSTGNIYIVYQSEGPISGGNIMHLHGDALHDIVLAKLDSNGNVLSVRQSPSLNTYGNNQYGKIVISPTDDLYIGYVTNGVVNDGSAGTSQLQLSESAGYITTVAKISDLSTGSVEWIHQDIYTTGYRLSHIRSNHTDSPFLVHKSVSDFKGNVYVAATLNNSLAIATGYSPSSINTNLNNPGNRPIIYKLDTTGKICWILSEGLPNSVALGTTSTGNLTPYDMIIDNEGNCVLGMYIFSGAISGQSVVGNVDAAIIKISSNGEILWTKQDNTFLSTAEDAFFSASVCVDTDNNIYFGDVTRGTISGNSVASGVYYPVIAKFNKNGNTIFAKSMPTLAALNNGACRYLKVSTNSTYIAMSYTVNGIVSATGETQNFGEDLIVALLDMSGDIVWTRQRRSFNTTGIEQYSDSSIDSSGNIYAVYYTNGTTTGNTRWGNSDIVVTKFDVSGETVWTKQSPAFNSTGIDMFPRLHNDLQNQMLYVVYRADGSISGSSGIVGGTDIVVFSMDYNGTVINVRQGLLSLNSSFNESHPNITVNNGSIYVTYSADSILNPNANLLPRNSTDIVLAKFSSTPTENTASLSIPFLSIGSITDVTKTSATLTWSSPEGIVTGYKIYREVNGVDQELIADTGNVLTYSLTGLQSNNHYQLKVAAYNSAGVGPKTRFMPFVTTPKQPTNITTTTSGSNTIVSWTPDDDMLQYAIYDVSGEIETLLTYSTSTSATIPTANITGTIGIKALGNGNGRSVTVLSIATPPPTASSSDSDIVTYAANNITSASNDIVSLLNSITDSTKLTSVFTQLVTNKGAASSISYLLPLITESTNSNVLQEIGSVAMADSLSSLPTQSTTEGKYDLIKSSVLSIQTTTSNNTTVIDSAVDKVYSLYTTEDDINIMALLYAARLSPTIKTLYYDKIKARGITSRLVTNSPILTDFKTTFTLDTDMSSDFNANTTVNVIIPDTTTIAIGGTTQNVPNYVAMTPNTTYTLSANSATATLLFNGTSLLLNGSAVALGEVFSVGGRNFRIDAIGSGTITDIGPTPEENVVCFLGSAPVKTANGYVKIRKLKVGDKVISAKTGNEVVIKRIAQTTTTASYAKNPFIVRKGMFGATQDVYVSPNHKIFVAGKGMVEARCLDLERANMVGSFDYFNICVDNNDNIIVANMEVESMADVLRIPISLEQFNRFIQLRFGGQTPHAKVFIHKFCRTLADGRIEIPVTKKLNT